MPQLCLLGNRDQKNNIYVPNRTNHPLDHWRILEVRAVLILPNKSKPYYKEEEALQRSNKNDEEKNTVRVSTGTIEQERREDSETTRTAKI